MQKLTKTNRLKFPSGTPEAYQDLAQRCLDLDCHRRPSFEEVLDLLTPLKLAATAGMLQAQDFAAYSCT
jgi:hypothetical protein